MSLYIAYSPTVKTRKVESIFYFRSNYCSLFSNGKKTSRVFKYDVLNIDVYRRVLQYTHKKHIDSYEVVISSRVNLSLLLSLLSSYLKDNDVTIGLITKNNKYINKHKRALLSHGVTCPGISDKPKYPSGFRFSLNPSAINQSPKETRTKQKVRAKAPIHAFDTFAILTNVSCAPRIELDESFHDKFIKLLRESGKENVEIYKKAGVSRQVFSKILSDKNMIPTKLTLISLCIGLELPLRTAKELMESAGYSLSNSIVLDAVVVKYIKQEKYDFELINSELNEYGCPLLGWHPRD